MNKRIILGKAKISIIATLIFAALSSFSVCVIPFLDNFSESVGQIVAYIIAAMFWAGLVAIFICVCLTRRILYKSRAKLIADGYIKKHQRIGIISFSKDGRMLAVYTITALGLILIVTDIIFSYVPEVLMFPIISVTILSFIFHCVIDGKYYKAYQLIKERADK